MGARLTYARCVGQTFTAYLSSTRHQDATGAISIAIVGAGATGVELAAELRHAAEELFSYGLGQVKPDNLKITVIEAGPRILPGLPERISNSVLKQLTHLGVNVLVNAAVSGIDETGLTTREGQRIKSDLKVWAAGIKASLFLKDLDGLETNNINQLVVGSTLQTTRDESILPSAIAQLVSIRTPEGTYHLALRQPTSRPRRWSNPCRPESWTSHYRRSHTRITAPWYPCPDSRQLAT